MTGWFEANRNRLGKRETAFTYFVDHLPENPVIVETGSLRSPGNVDGDGNASMLFDELTRDGGKVYSIDIDAGCGVNLQEHCGPQVQFVKQDSCEAVGHLSHIVKRVDLLYLDSLDVDFAADDPAARHALRECQYSLRMLDKNSLIAVDDNDFEGRGKGRLVSEFAKLKGWPLVVDGYVKVWRCSNGHR